jgi:S-DNA-T family DNA segregation ATPase FtsK/SpoIIIE
LSGPDQILLGLGGHELEPQLLSEAADGCRWLVAGPQGSGVSSLLLLIARRLLAHGREIAVLSERAGPLDSVRSDPRVAWLSSADAAPLRVGPELAVLVDDADQVRGEGLERGGLVVCGGNATALASRYHGLAHEVARARTGVLLGPRSPVEGELFGTRVRPEPAAPPGRGYVIRRGSATPFQAALPDT